MAVDEPQGVRETIATEHGPESVGAVPDGEVNGRGAPIPALPGGPRRRAEDAPDDVHSEPRAGGGRRPLRHPAALVVEVEMLEPLPFGHQDLQDGDLPNRGALLREAGKVGRDDVPARVEAEPDRDGRERFRNRPGQARKGTSYVVLHHLVAAQIDPASFEARVHRWRVHCRRSAKLEPGSFSGVGFPSALEYELPDWVCLLDPEGDDSRRHGGLPNLAPNLRWEKREQMEAVVHSGRRRGRIVVRWLVSAGEVDAQRRGP